MRNVILGGLGALLLVVAGLTWWSGWADGEAALPPVGSLPPEPLDEADLVGEAPPAVPEARQATREERRFNRYDRDRDGRISRVEMMSSRTAAFRKLDTDGNNLLSFEEWAVATSDRFAGADADRSNWLSRAEFATTARSPTRSKCAC